jgi:hypothetical protein
MSVPNLTIVYVPLRDSWPCERCTEVECVAYVAVDGVEETMGYCGPCLALEVVAAMRESDADLGPTPTLAEVVAYQNQPESVANEMSWHGSAKPLKPIEPHDFESETGTGDFDGLNGPCAVCGYAYRNLVHHRDPNVAWDRPEWMACEKSTEGCSVNHTNAGLDSECATW